MCRECLRQFLDNALVREVLKKYGGKPMEEDGGWGSRGPNSGLGKKSKNFNQTWERNNWRVKPTASGQDDKDGK